MRLHAREAHNETKLRDTTLASSTKARSMNPDVVLPQWRELQTAARAARGNAWAPYSGYHVGAAVLASDGRIFAGCNVENASYGLTICAERVAICTAIAQGCSSFIAICVSLTGIPVPCGACRQFLVE
ncbi:MAG: cytidine deaminase, partial [Fuerstia sp.]|nr:cytidine deaminase [Fuerstiella sp.]